MGRQPQGMGNLHPAQNNVIAIGKAMGIKTVADTHDYLIEINVEIELCLLI